MSAPAKSHTSTSGTTGPSRSAMGQVVDTIASFLKAVLVPTIIVAVAFFISDHSADASAVLIKAGAYAALLGAAGNAGAYEVGRCFGKHARKVRRIAQSVGTAGWVVGMLLVGGGFIAGI